LCSESESDDGTGIIFNERCPLDNDGLQAAVRSASGNVIVLHEGNRTGGFGAEIVARPHEFVGNEIALKIARVATPDMRIPASPILQRPLSSHGREAT
jgi:2-oxoisovalerate dehydrogenase E1 component